MINRADAFWAWVWNGDVFSRRKRLVIDTSIDGSWCIAIAPDDEEHFLKSNNGYSTITWSHYERIPEPKKRLMNREEILGFIAWNPHSVIRHGHGRVDLVSTFIFVHDLSEYEWAPITESGEIGEWSKFYKEVEE